MATAVVNSRQKIRRLIAWCLFLLLVWGLWLWRLDASDLTFDEAATYFIASRTPFDIVAYLRQAVREHPPLYYLLINSWMTLTGTREFSLRLFSVSVGLIVVVLTGWVARLTYCHSLRDSGLLAAATLALMPGVAYYVREARMYSLVLLWLLISAGLFLRDWFAHGERPSWRSVASLLVVNLLAAATHYYSLLFIIVQPAVLLLLRRWRSLTAWLISHGIILLAGLAWLMSAPGLQMTTAVMFDDLALVIQPLDQIQYLVGKLLFSPVVGFNVTLLYIVLIVAVVGIVFCLWWCRALGVYLLCALLLPLGLAYMLPQAPAPRYVLGLLPNLAIVLGIACQSAFYVIERRGPASAVSAGAAACVFLVLVSGGLYDALQLERSRYGRTIQLVKANSRPGDAVLFYGPWQSIQYYYYYDPGYFPPIVSLPAQAPPRLKPSEAEPVLESLLNTYDRVWVLPASVSDVDPDHFVEGWLNAHAHRVWKTEDFQLYLGQLSADAPVEDQDAVFGQCLSLERVSYEAENVPAGESVRLALYWRPQCRVDDFKLTLTLADGQGHIWTEAHSLPLEWWTLPSEWPTGVVAVDREGVLVPQGAPPGEYVVRLAVADAETGETLSTQNGKDVDLVTFHVDEPTHIPVLSESSGALVFCPPGEGECLTLVDCEPGGERFQQGYAVPFKLRWLVPYSLQRDIRFRLRISPRTWLPAKHVAPIAEKILYLPDFAAAPQRTGSLDGIHVFLPLVVSNGVSAAPVVPDSFKRVIALPDDALSLPASAQTGPARVTLEVLGPDGSPWLSSDGQSVFPLFDIRIENRPVLRRLPSGLTRIEVDFGEEIALRGYRIDGDAHPGGKLRLSYVWYAREKPQAIYAVFNHLVGVDGQSVAQVDGWPQEGRMLTTQWQPGEYVEDHYTLTIPGDVPTGPYLLCVGLYNAATGERLPVYQDGVRLDSDYIAIEVAGEER